MEINKKFLLLFLILFWGQAWAGLGDKVESVRADQMQMKAHKKAAVKSSAGYTVHEMDVDGTTVKEYVSADDYVFAVTWKGIHRPDLSVLLGSYHSEYKSEQTISRRHHGRQPVNIKGSSSLRVRQAGHMRDLRGQAYLENLLPENFDLGVLSED